MPNAEPAALATHHVHHAALGRVAILGVGLIGGSLGQALCAIGAGDPVVGWDADESVGCLAIDKGAIHKAASSPEEAVAGARLVVLAGPLDSIVPTLHRIAKHLDPDAAVTDVASAKARLVREAESIIGSRFVGGHPMAGSEESGVAASSVDLFDAASWILTPTPLTDRRALETVRKMVELAGATPRECDPETHDALVASLSHLPHLAAFGLARTAGALVPAETRDLVAGSFRSGTRVAKSDPGNWADILLDNQTHTLRALDEFLTWAEEARSTLESGDRAALTDLLTHAHQARKQFPQ